MNRPFIAARDRRRTARSYVYRVKPLLLVVLFVLTLTSWLADPETIPLALWGICATFIGIQVVWVLLVRAGRDPMLVAGASLIVDSLIEFAALFASPAPVGSSSTISFFIVAAAYFLPAWITIAFSVSCTAGIVVASRVIERWNEPFAFPTTAFLALALGLLSAYIMSRVRRTERRLEEAVAEQLAARESIEQLGRVRDRLIANVSHELRTPLTSTIGFIETILRDDIELSEEDRIRLTRHARDGGIRLLSLVEDLLTLGTTRPDSLLLDQDETDLHEVIREAIEALPASEGRPIQVDCSCGDRPTHRVRVDRGRIAQVVTNLVVNAERHGEGTIEVRCVAEELGIRIDVLDEGAGVAAEHASELFMPFARFSDRPDSTGLGLAICRAIVEAHGGTIDYARDPDGRTRFSMHLPVAEPVGEAAPTA